MSADLAELLTAIDAEASGFTLCEVARGRGISGTSSDSVTAFLVLSGTLYLHLKGGGKLKARPGEMALVPAQVAPVIAAQASVPDSIVAGAQSLRRRDGLPVALAGARWEGRAEGCGDAHRGDRCRDTRRAVAGRYRRRAARPSGAGAAVR